MLDQDGYPTKETLDKLKNWEMFNFHGLIQFLKKTWWTPSLISLEDNTCYLSTGGWSGNEEMIDAINPYWKTMHFYQHTRGGHYIFTKMGKSPHEGERSKCK